MEGSGFARTAVTLIIFSSVVTGDNEKNLPNSDCVNTITCKSATLVAKCPTCDPRYFYCSGPGAPPEGRRCPSGMYFNPDPLFPRCLLINNCPYRPPFFVPTTSETKEDGCVDTVICGDEPFVPKCNFCDPRYFYCSEPGAQPVLKNCHPGQMFNIDPLYLRCILTNNCPYHPPWTTPSTTTTTTPTTTTTTTTSTTTAATTTTATTTTTTTTPTTTTTTTTAFSGCVDTFTCKESGNFARCNYCHPSYFYCEKAGVPGIRKLCDDPKLFNTDPAYPECIPEDDCPYHPHNL